MSAPPVVLLLESDPVLRRLRTEVLQRAGYRVTASDDPDEVLATYSPRMFDLIVVGTNGHTAAGLEFCERVRELDPEQRIILVTRSNEYISQDACPDDQVSDGPDQLVSKVAAALS